MADKSERPPLLDRALLAVAPGVAARRIQARALYEATHRASMSLRKYEAAKTGRRNDGWIRPGTSANAEVASSFSMVARSARQMVRDNGHAANAVTVLTNNTIGTGIRAGIDAESDSYERQIQELWQEHVEGSGSGSGEVGGVYQRQELAFRAIVESGGALLRRRRRTNQSMTLPYVVQVMEPDYLATHMDGMLIGRNRIIGGKEFTPRDELAGFHLYTEHPGDAFTLAGTSARTTFVSPENISHAFRMDRPGQSLGISWFAPIINSLRDIADTRDNYQLRQKIASCYAVFLYESEPSQTGQGGQVEPIGTHIEPGRVESVPPGKQVAFADPPGVEGMADYDRAQLMTVSAGFGIPYEALTGDLANVNFLSGRMGWLAFYRNIDVWRKNVVIPRICEREMRWFLESIAVSRGMRQPVRITWESPHRDLLDPKKEIDALRDEIRLGTLSYPDAVRMRGRNPTQVIQSYQKWLREIDEAGLVLDWDGRKSSRSGNQIEKRDNQEEEGTDDA